MNVEAAYQVFPLLLPAEGDDAPAPAAHPVTEAGGFSRQLGSQQYAQLQSDTLTVKSSLPQLSQLNYHIRWQPGQSPMVFRL